MREGKPLPYGVGCIGFAVRYVDSRVAPVPTTKSLWIDWFCNVVIDAFGAVVSVFR